MALLDKINQQRQQQPQQAMGQTQAAQRLLQAKSGKAGTDQAPVGIETERMIADQTTGQMKQAGQQAQLQGMAAQQQSEGIQQQSDWAQSSIDMAQQKLQQNRQEVMADLQLRAAQAADRLGLNKQQAAQDARLFARRMSDARYIQQLKQEGSLKRLTNEANFKREMREQIYGDALTNLLQSQEYSRLLSANERDFQEELNRLSNKDAWKAAVAAIKQGQTRATIGAITGGFAAGMGVGGRMGGTPKQEPTQTTQPSGGYSGTDYTTSGQRGYVSEADY